jgi:hypothetical protein
VIVGVRSRKPNSGSETGLWGTQDRFWATGSPPGKHFRRHLAFSCSATEGAPAWEAVGLPPVPNRRVGFYQEARIDRSTFAVISLWGKFGGLYACRATFPYIVPLQNIFLTRLFSKRRLKRKDFQEIVACLGRRRSRVQISAPRPIYVFCFPSLRDACIFVEALVNFS